MVENLKKLLVEYPDVIREKKKFKALLYDYFPLKRKEANALYMAYELGIPENMLELPIVAAVDIIRYERQLKHNYGLDDELILQVISLWAQALDVEIDNEFLLSKEKSENLDEDIYKKYEKIDNVYQQITMAIKDKFPFVRENYNGTSKLFDDIIHDLYQYDSEKAIEVWLWVLNLYWKRLDENDPPSDTLIFSVLYKVSGGRKDDEIFVSDLEKYPMLLKYIFRKGNNLEHRYRDILVTMLKLNKMDLFQKALSYIYENRRENQLNTDEIIEAVVKNIRPSGGTMLSAKAFQILEAEVNCMKSDVIRDNTKKLLEKKKKDVNYFSKAVPDRNVRKQKWDFAALKEKAIEMRKREPLWNGYKFISFTTVVGLFYRSDKSDILEDLKEGDMLSLKREPDNEYDSMAVAVYDTKSRKMGYLPKESNTFMATMMDAGQEFIGRLYSFSKSHGGANIAIEIFVKQ